VSAAPPAGDPADESVLPDFDRSVDESLLELDSEDEDDAPNMWVSVCLLVLCLFLLLVLLFVFSHDHPFVSFDSSFFSLLTVYSNFISSR
jgi:hypothetical protein